VTRIALLVVVLVLLTAPTGALRRCLPDVSKASPTYPVLVWPRGCQVAL